MATPAVPRESLQPLPPSERRSGVLTVLATDVEGSTALWEHHPAWMAVAHARHEAILRAAITAHGGHVRQQIGDAFQATFPAPEAALGAAVAAQRALSAVSNQQSADEPDPVSNLELKTQNSKLALKVRMALASAAPGEDEPALLRRLDALLPAGNGGQILLPAATADAVRAALPPGVWLRDLGERMLKNLAAPEHLWQAVVPDVPDQFRPLRLSPGRPHNLPRQLTSFVGREREAAEVAALLRQPATRLVTLTGPGGTGKTRLSLQVAADLLDEYADGVCFVDLAALTAPELVLPTIARTLGIHEQPGIPIADTLAAALAAQQRLLVLDNFEQLLPAAPALATLLTATRHVQLLISSRARLGLPDETRFPVPPLPVPDLATPLALEQIAANDAVRLFSQRAQARAPGFALTPATAPAVAAICAALDGLPLAVELAAARVGELGLAGIQAGLTDRLALLAGRLRGRAARQQTIRGAIAWSYDLLAPREQQLFRRLAVFQGGATLDAVGAVCQGYGAPLATAIPGIQTLISHSLLQERAGRAGEPRLETLETIHEYAREQLAASGEAEPLQRRHAGYFLRLVEEAAPHLDGPDPTLWHHRLADEDYNCRAALDWAAARGEAETEVRLATALRRYWVYRGNVREGRDRLVAALARLPSASPPALRAKALDAVAEMASWLGDRDLRRVACAERLALCAASGDARGMAGALDCLAAEARITGHYAQARTYAEQGLALYREAGDVAGTAYVLGQLAYVHGNQGDFAAARTYFEERLQLAREVGEIGLLTDSLNNLAYFVPDDGGRVARALWEEALALSRAAGGKIGIAMLADSAAWGAMVQGDYAAARALAEEAATLAREMEGWRVRDELLTLALVAAFQGDSATATRLLVEALRGLAPSNSGLPRLLAGFAGAAAAQGRPEAQVRAAMLLGAAEALQRVIVNSRWLPLERLGFAPILAATRAQLSPAEFEQAWVQGQMLTADQAIAYALDGAPDA